MNNYLKGVIDRSEGDFVIVKTTGDQELYWPKNSINFNYQDGEMVNICITKDEPETYSKTEEAKSLLKQIFQTNV